MEHRVGFRELLETELVVQIQGSCIIRLCVDAYIQDPSLKKTIQQIRKLAANMEAAQSIQARNRIGWIGHLVSLSRRNAHTVNSPNPRAA